MFSPLHFSWWQQVPTCDSYISQCINAPQISQVQIAARWFLPWDTSVRKPTPWHCYTTDWPQASLSTTCLWRGGQCAITTHASTSAPEIIRLSRIWPPQNILAPQVNKGSKSTGTTRHHSPRKAKDSDHSNSTSTDNTSTSSEECDNARLQKDIVGGSQDPACKWAIKIHWETKLLQNRECKALHVSCKFCSYHWSSYTLLDSHVHACHQENNHECIPCRKIFCNLQSLNKHLKKHSLGMPIPPSVHAMRPWSSTVCQHGSIMVKGYKCHQCKVSFPFKSKLKTHEHAHSEQCAFKCTQPDCGKEYKHVSFYNYHLRSHGKSKLQCLICEYFCNDVILFHLHMEKHVPVDRYQCRDCNYTTKYHKTMIAHEVANKHKCKWFENMPCVLFLLNLVTYMPCTFASCRTYLTELCIGEQLVWKTIHTYSSSYSIDWLIDWVIVKVQQSQLWA